jgi:hypothetical protein|tara:strand:+ start:929 stop:1522 length:594 start_codon:yes stop_codon:yes gene_type:complete
MEHFVRIVMEKNDTLNESLDESIFPSSELYESEQGATIIQIPLARQLSEEESTEYANRLANYMFEQGHEDFDIEVSTDITDDLDEETYEDDDEFYAEYGEMWYNEDDIMDEAEYQGRKVKLGKPMQGDVKKFKVYVKDPKTGNTKKVNFGHGGSSVKGKAMKIKKSNPARRRSFRARHNCDNPGPRTKARYWSCRKW